LIYKLCDKINIIIFIQLFNKNKLHLKMKYTLAIAVLLASTQAVRLSDMPYPTSSIDDTNSVSAKTGRAKSESMPQHGGTATDNSKAGSATHGEAKVNQTDVAKYRELSDVVVKNSLTAEGSLHAHLNGKGIDATTAGGRTPIPSYLEDGKKEKSVPSALPNPAPAPVIKADVVADAKVVEEIVKKNDKEEKDNLKVVKAENAEKAAEKRVEVAEEKAKEDEKLAKEGG
jgi:hypothetical protein